MVGNDGEIMGTPAKLATGETPLLFSAKLATGETAGEMFGIEGEMSVIGGDSEGIDGESDLSDVAASTGILALLPLIGAVVAIDDDLTTGMRGDWDALS